MAHVVAPPVLRIALSVPFFRSGLTRWDGFLSLSPRTIFLFEEEFKLHIFGAAYDLPAPLVIAYVTAVAEIVLPVLLVAGFATRFAALGLLVMTGIIQLVVRLGQFSSSLGGNGDCDHRARRGPTIRRPTDRKADDPLVIDQRRRVACEPCGRRYRSQLPA
jgi:uncharacterized membrane protein YphA (DoxX/SURF4 family)